MASVVEFNPDAEKPVEAAQSPTQTTAPSSSSCIDPVTKPPAKKNIGDLTLLSILLMGENGKKAMEALREADKRVVCSSSIMFVSKLFLSFRARTRFLTWMCFNFQMHASQYLRNAPELL
jgi:hypothetical protein